MRNQEFDGLFNSLILLLFAKLQRHIDLVKVARVPDLSGGKDVENSGEDHPGDSNNGPFLTPSFCDALIFDAIVRRILGIHSRMGDLNKSRLEINPSSGDADRLLFTGGLVVARGKARPCA